MVGGMRSADSPRNKGRERGGGGSPITLMEIGVLLVLEALPPH